MPHTDPENISALHRGFHILLDTPAAAGFIASVLAAWGGYWLHTRFVTYKHLAEFKEQNRKEHKRIEVDMNETKENVQWIRGYLERRDDDV